MRKAKRNEGLVAGNTGTLRLQGDVRGYKPKGREGLARFVKGYAAPHANPVAYLGGLGRDPSGVSQHRKVGGWDYGENKPYTRPLKTPEDRKAYQMARDKGNLIIGTPLTPDEARHWANILSPPRWKRARKKK